MLPVVCALDYRSRYVPAFIRVMQLVQHRRLPLTSLFFAGPDFLEPLDVTAPPFAASRFYAPVALGIWCADWEVGCEALGTDGHFGVLRLEAHGDRPERDVPRYDVGWVAEDPGGSRQGRPAPRRDRRSSA